MVVNSHPLYRLSYSGIDDGVSNKSGWYTYHMPALRVNEFFVFSAVWGLFAALC
jgi:hypothetical protein